MTNFINTKIYPLSENSTITTQLLKNLIQQFWTEVFLPINQNKSDQHLILMCKVEFVGTSNGYKTLGNARRVNITDQDLFFEYISNRLNLLNDTYTVSPCSNVIFTYVISNGLADENRLLKQNFDYKVAMYSFNNYQLPLTMNPLEYGVLIAEQNKGETTRYVVKNDIHVFTIDINKEATVNKVRIEGAADLTWVDTKIDDNTFNRNLGKSEVYVRNGKVVVKAKQLPAKAFTKGKLDKNLTPEATFMTMDIEASVMSITQMGTEMCARKATRKGSKCGVNVAGARCGRLQFFVRV